MFVQVELSLSQAKLSQVHLLLSWVRPTSGKVELGLIQTMLKRVQVGLSLFSLRWVKSDSCWVELN